MIKGYSSNPNSSNTNDHDSNPNSSNDNSTEPFNQIPKMKSIKLQSPDITQPSMRLDTIVSSLFDMKTHIKNQSKIVEFEQLIDLVLLKFNEMQAEKFNLLQQINNLEKENDNLYQQTKENENENENDHEFKEVLFTDGLETEQSVILVDYWTDKNKHKNDNQKDDNEYKSWIAPWTKYFNRHKQGIGEVM